MLQCAFTLLPIQNLVEQPTWMQMWGVQDVIHLHNHMCLKVGINEHNHEMEDMQNMNEVIWPGNSDDDMQLDK